jgi:uncharacterized protein YfbU (UPF0304 family)
MRKKYTQYLGQRGYKVQLPELVWIFDKMPTKYERKVIKKLKLYGYGIIWCEVTKVQQ